MTLTGWGLIGTGEISRSFAADLTESSGSRRLAVASRDEGRARAFADANGIERANGGVEAMLADPEVQVVHIGTPHGTHRNLALQVLRAGKHVVVEKPIGLDASQAREIRDAAAEAGLFAMEGMWMKFSPAYQRILADVAAGRIGEPRSVRASFGIPFPTDTGSRWSAELGGSTLLDQGIYPITLAMDLFGVPNEIIARGQVRPDGVDLAEHVTLEFADGRFAQVAASMVEFCDLSATVNGRSGWISVPTPFWVTSRYRTHSAESEQEFMAGVETEIPLVGNGFTPMIAHVNAMIAGGRTESDVHPFRDTFAVFEVLDEIRAQLLAARPATDPTSAGDTQ